MKLGDAFYYKDDMHLWIVISNPNPEQEVVVVSVTTKEPYKDSTCELHAGDHPKIKHDSIVYFRKAKLDSISRILREKATGHIPSVSSAILAKIHDGAAITQFIDSDCKDLMLAQGLIA